MQLHYPARSPTVSAILAFSGSGLMRLFLSSLRALIFLSFAGPHAAIAQGVGSLFSTTEPTPEAETAKATEDITQIIKQARESGMGVIVIDAEGKVLSGLSETDAAVAPPVETESSGIMKAQDAAVRFRGALVERSLDLPNAFNEVIYILRATSADGTIWMFFRAFYMSMLLFAIGMVVEKLVYGRRIAIHYVVARTVDNPQGYSEKMPFLVFRFFMGVIGIFVAMTVAYVIGFTVYGPLEDTALQFTAGIINLGYFLCRFLAQLWRMILSPYLPQYRIPLLETGEARRLHLWLIAIGTLEVCRLLFCIWISELGLNYDIFAFLMEIVTTSLKPIGDQHRCQIEKMARFFSECTSDLIHHLTDEVDVFGEDLGGLSTHKKSRVQAIFFQIKMDLP